MDLVQLDRDHPGFRDPEYRERRNAIAALALAHRIGDPAPRIQYTSREHEVWRVVHERLAPLHARYACAEFLAQWPRIGFEGSRISQLADVSETLTKATGFSLSPVAGLVTPRTFMRELSRGRFLATQYMRHHSRPLYTPEPDVIHELVGHVALLADPKFADINRLFGEATERADDAQIEALIRLYWYALEFGVVRGAQGLRVVGAGLLSSFGELEAFEARAHLRPFDIAQIASMPFDPTDYQGVLFVAESTEQMLADLRRHLEAHITSGSASTKSRFGGRY